MHSSLELVHGNPQGLVRTGWATVFLLKPHHLHGNNKEGHPPLFLSVLLLVELKLSILAQYHDFFYQRCEESRDVKGMGNGKEWVAQGREESERAASASETGRGLLGGARGGGW